MIGINALIEDLRESLVFHCVRTQQEDTIWEVMSQPLPDTQSAGAF